jgi:toxin secretion/phage lysis holin
MRRPFILCIRWEGFIMDSLLDVRYWSAGIGGILGEYLGSFDSLMYALMAFIVTDYITGLMCAIVERNLSSEIGFRGICHKVFILMLVGVANVIDVNVIGGGCVLRSAVIFFYISNEGISIIENAARIGLPVPEKLTSILKQLRGHK